MLTHTVIEHISFTFFNLKIKGDVPHCCNEELQQGMFYHPRIFITAVVIENKRGCSSHLSTVIEHFSSTMERETYGLAYSFDIFFLNNKNYMHTYITKVSNPYHAHGNRKMRLLIKLFDYKFITQFFMNLNLSI